MSWAIRVTFANGTAAFLRRGFGAGDLGHGPIVTYYLHAYADADAAIVREGLDAGDVVTVIERSHGRKKDPAPSPTPPPSTSTR